MGVIRKIDSVEAQRKCDAGIIHRDHGQNAHVCLVSLSESKPVPNLNSNFEP